MTQIYDVKCYAKNLEKDGKITLVKGKPFTGVREGEKPYQEKYYKDGELIISCDDRHKTTIKIGLAEEEKRKAMNEIYTFRGGTWIDELRNLKPKK